MGFLYVDRLRDFNGAAIKFRKELLRLPIVGISDTLKYMTPRPGVRYQELVGTSSVSGVQLAPYKCGARTDAELQLTLRSLYTYFGSVNADFEPNSAIQTLLGHKAAMAMGDAQTQTPTAKEVLALIAKQVSASFNDAIFRAKRKTDGTTTLDLFDGFDTITEEEVTSGKISAAEKNYIKLTSAITKANAVDALKEILFALDPLLRKEECFLFCDYATADAYNEAYLMTHTGIVYNDRYNQVTVEGSNNRLVIVPLASKQGSKYIHVAPKSNMLVGFDQMSDKETVRVKEYAPDVLTFMMRMFFGVQFESVDRRRLFVAELAE